MDQTLNRKFKENPFKYNIILRNLSKHTHIYTHPCYRLLPIDFRTSAFDWSRSYLRI